MKNAKAVKTVPAEEQSVKSAHLSEIKVKDICSSPERPTSPLPTLDLN